MTGSMTKYIGQSNYSIHIGHESHMDITRTVRKLLTLICAGKEKEVKQKDEKID